MVRAFAVRGEDNGFVDDVRHLLVARIEERCGATEANDEGVYQVALSLDADRQNDGFEFEPGDGGVRIAGHGRSGLLAGVGEFLRTSRYDAAGFTPLSKPQESKAACDIRGVYFATHFLNWYHVAPEHEIVRYVEDLSLWGMNYLLLAFPIMNLAGWDDPETDAFFERVAIYWRVCRRLGIRIGILDAANQDFRVRHGDFAATPNREGPTIRKGDHGNSVCPVKPGATEYLVGNFEELVRRLAPTPPDIIGFWPYDEGGCGCDDCFPWGGNGFLKLSRALADRARTAFPEVKLLLSTWVFDTPPAGEWDLLARSLEENGPWVDYILADSHEDFPRYPLDVGVPGKLPLVNFPEISMWGLGPWGGFGANPLPARVGRLWNQVKHVARGGFPYSEGLFEDINKAAVLHQYWHADGKPEDAIRQYASYEYAGADSEDVLDLIRGIERNHAAVAEKCSPDVGLSDETARLATRIDGELLPFARASWRWRILYLRAVLDRERYAAAAAEGVPSNRDWGRLLARNAVAQEAFRELMAIYHCRETVDDTCPQHAWVRPPLA